MDGTTRNERERFFAEALTEQTTVTMFEIGCEQLRHAITHFTRREFIAATTLAGAAEEVLGSIAKTKAGTNALDRSWQWHVKVAKLFSLSQEPTLKDIKNDLNRVRNELKHNDGGANGAITRQLGAAALKLIDSAVLNIIIIEDFRPPADPEIAKYHTESPTWDGEVP